MKVVQIQTLLHAGKPTEKNNKNSTEILGYENKNLSFLKFHQGKLRVLQIIRSNHFIADSFISFCRNYTQ